MNKKNKKWLTRLAAGAMALLLAAGTAATDLTVYAADQSAQESSVSVRKITGFAELPEKQKTIRLTGKIGLKRLLEKMPQSIEVYLDGETGKTSIPVTWSCVGDYDNSDYFTYQFKPKWDTDVYKLGSGLKGMFNVQQTNLQETKPEKWEALKEQFKIPAIKDEQGMLTVPLIDAMVREQQWICPIYSKEGNSAYHARGEDNHIVVPLKGQFKDGENFYSTLLHEMAHSTGEPEHLNREKGVIFGDKQYAKEELVAELTSATVGQSLGISTHIREENAMYLKNWLGALKEDPKFIYNILADVGKASNMIQEHTARMEQYLTPEERFTQAVLQDNRPVLEQMKNEGFTPSSRLLESVAANHPTADNLETLHSTFGISLPSMEAEPAMKNMNEPQLGL